VAKIRKMIGDVPAFYCSIEGARVFELRTDGKVKWMRPNLADEGTERFCESMRITGELAKAASYQLREGQLSSEMMRKIFQD